MRFLLLHSFFRPVTLPTDHPVEDDPSRLTDLLLRHIHRWLTEAGLDPARDAWQDRLLILAAILLTGALLHLLGRYVLAPIIHYTVRHTRFRWDSILLQRTFFRHALDMMAPLTVWILLPLAIAPAWTQLNSLLSKALIIYLTVLGQRVLLALAGSAFDYYHLRHGRCTTHPYKSALEMATLFIKTLMVLTIGGILLDLTLSGLITILSAFAALLALIFKDTLLGFIAGMMLLQNRMLRPGDWIGLPGTTTQGVIEEINIMTVRLRDHDNTYYYVPTYTLLTHTYQNWSGMKEGGLRLVRRQILFDWESIRPLRTEELAALSASPLLAGLLPPEEQERYHAELREAETLTNLTLLHRWVERYLSHLPEVSPEPFLLIRARDTTGEGFPLEFQFFLRVTVWVDVERQQTLITERLLSVLPAFGLRGYQVQALPREHTVTAPSG
jgi:miniconductance mechanosensitive channel